MNKKICLITSVFSPHTRGGAESVVTNIVNGFRKTDHQIFVITIQPFKSIRSLWPKKYEQDGIMVYRFYPLNLFSYLNINKYKKQPWLRVLWHGLDMFNLHSYLAIKYILKKEKPQVVMTHVLKGIGYLTCRAVKSSPARRSDKGSLRSEGGPARRSDKAPLGSEGRGIKNIHTLHDVQLATPSGLILKGEEKSWQHTFFGTQLFQYFNRLLLNNPDVIISSSKFLLDFYNQIKFFPKSEKFILTNPVNVKPNECHPERSEGSRGIRDGQFNFLFLGQIEKYKGTLLLINVFKKLLQEADQNIKLLIVGTGSATQQAKQIAGDEKRIEFLGYVPNQELNKIFNQSNATIVSSLCYENSPTVIFESLSYGVPVLAARIGGIEFVKDNYNGFTFEAGDPDDLLKILKFSLANKKKLADMSANCIQSIKEIGVEKYIEKLEEII